VREALEISMHAGRGQTWLPDNGVFFSFFF